MNGLSTAQIEPLQLRLRQEHADLRRELADELKRTAEGRFLELAGQVHDRGDEAVADLLGDLEIASLARHAQRIRRVEGALAAIDQGSYGLCGTCAAPIASGRLQADPAAERCLDCQTTAEQGRHAPTL